MRGFFEDQSNSSFNYDDRWRLAKALFVATGTTVVPCEKESLVSCVVNGTLRYLGKEEVAPYSDGQKEHIYIGEEPIDLLWDAFRGAVEPRLAKEDRVLNGIGFLVKPKIFHVMRDRGTDVEIYNLVGGVAPCWPNFVNERVSHIPPRDIVPANVFIDRLIASERRTIEGIAHQMRPYILKDVGILKQGYQYIDPDFP